MTGQGGGIGQVLRVGFAYGRWLADGRIETRYSGGHEMTPSEALLSMRKLDADGWEAARIVDDETGEVLADMDGYRSSAVDWQEAKQ
jgi:hypothetical protein